MKIRIDPGGLITMIHHDHVPGLPDMTEYGTIIGAPRASHVEPEFSEDGTLSWYADLTPVGGPVLRGYTTRKEALAAEIEWIENNVLEQTSTE